MHPQPRMQVKKHTSVVTTGSPDSPGVPCAIGFNGFLRALPGERAFLPPLPVQCVSIVASLASASRCQDHTTSPSAMTPLVRQHHPRPSHPAPNVRDDRETPLLIRRGTREEEPLICPSAQAECLRLKAG